MVEFCVLCGNETKKRVIIAHSPRAICQHCVDNIVGGEVAKAIGSFGVTKKEAEKIIRTMQKETN